MEEVVINYSKLPDNVSSANVDAWLDKLYNKKILTEKEVYSLTSTRNILLIF